MSKSDSLKAYWNRPGVREARRAIAKASANRPEVRAKVSERTRIGLANPEAKAKRRRYLKQAWQDGVYAHLPELMRDISREVHNRPEIKASKSAAQKRSWEENRQHRIQRIRDVVSTPEKRAKCSLAYHRQRGKMSGPEKKLQAVLDARSWRYGGTGAWSFGQPISADFLRPRLRLIVQVDGCFWHNCPKCGYKGRPWMPERDAEKTRYARQQGWVVLRFWEHDIEKNLPKVLARITRTEQQLLGRL